MPQLRWDETDVILCLGVVPEVEEYETTHRFSVTQEGLALDLQIWQYDSAIRISLARVGASHALVSMTLIILGSVDYRNDKRGEFLLFRDCVVAPDRFGYFWFESSSFESKPPHLIVLQISIKPDIQIKILYPQDRR